MFESHKNTATSAATWIVYDVMNASGVCGSRVHYVMSRLFSALP